jgi:hypothetical protein
VRIKPIHHGLHRSTPRSPAGTKKKKKQTQATSVCCWTGLARFLSFFPPLLTKKKREKENAGATRQA